MPRLPTELSGFTGPFAGVNGHYELCPSRDDLVRAAVSTGYPNLATAIMPPTFQRTWAVLFRASIVLAYLDASTEDRIIRSEDYNRADRSEKVAISYYLGLFAAKLGAEALLRTPWLWHYDAYHRLTQGVNPITRRPDLIGQATTGEWITIEAKGRTNGWNAKLRAAAKNQALTIDQIVEAGANVVAVAGNVASICYFDAEGWCLLMDDPPARGRPLRFTRSPEELYRAYYRPLLEYVLAALQRDAAESVRVDGVDYKVVWDPDLDLFVGLANAIIETRGVDVDRLRRAFREALSDRGDGLTPSSQRSRDDSGREWSVGPDGVIVRLGEHWR